MCASELASLSEGVSSVPVFLRDVDLTSVTSVVVSSIERGVAYVALSLTVYLLILVKKVWPLCLSEIVNEVITSDPCHYQ